MSERRAESDLRRGGSRWPLLLIELLMLAVLVGGLLATGAVGFIAFSASDLLSFEQAGKLMARVFEGSVWVEAGAVAILGLAALGRGRWRRAALVFVVLGSLVAGHVVLSHQMKALRQRHGGSLAALAKEHPDRRSFGRRHGIYSVLSLGLLAASVGFLAGSARESRGDASPKVL